MRLTRLTIAEILGTIGCCAVGFAGLMYASSPWAGLAFSITLGSLTLGWIAIIYRRSERRAFWIGFMICGWSYVIFTYTPWISDIVGSQLVTTRLLRWAYPILVPEAHRPATSPNANQSLLVPLPELGEGIDSEMTGVGLIDVLAKGKGKEPPLPLAEGISFGTARHGRKIEGLYLQVNPVQFARVSLAKADGVKLVLQRHSPSPFAGVWSSPPTQIEDYLRVGHAFFGLLGALAGGVVGKYLHATRERSSENATPLL